MTVHDQICRKWLVSTLLFFTVIPGSWTVAAEQPVQLTAAYLTTWLSAYGDAWVSRDPEKAAELFSEDTSYQVNPYEQPHVGRTGVYDYWAEVTATQSNIKFDYQTISVTGKTGIAHWSAEFDIPSAGIRIKLDGIFVLEFDQSGKCERLREWWHSETEKLATGS